MYEFSKAVNSIGCDINTADVQGLFKSFDLSGEGTIDFDEFIRVIKGPLNQFRQQIVLRVFKSLDVNGDGCLSVEDIKGKYNASNHPDVKSGKRTENEILTEFLETFEQHHNVSI